MFSVTPVFVSGLEELAVFARKAIETNSSTTFPVSEELLFLFNKINYKNILRKNFLKSII